ncbi:MAG: SCP2 sterol-binding domain-containing protein [Methylococcales bacterium]|nr:SCP2 sterol-binding domain-containing protein [Methylococcales bacterium]
MPGGLRHIKPLLFGSLETALNRYLSMDEHVEQLLLPLAGKVIAVRVMPYGETLYLCPTTHSIQILENFQGNTDATLSGTLSALGLMGLSATPMRALFNGQVQIEGDTVAAGKLQRLFAKLDINIENRLARHTGEQFARHLTGFVQGGGDWLKHSAENFRLNLEEYLQEETRDLPAKPEAERLFRETDDCRSDFDRLNARFQRLKAALVQFSEPQQPTGSQP